MRLTVLDGVDAQPLVELALAATDAALARAVEKAARLHLVRDARADPQRLPVIDVQFRGAPLPAGLNAEISKRLRTSIAAQVAHLLVQPNTDVAAAPQQLAPDEAAAERFDERRLIPQRHAVDDAYRVPSYGGKGAHTGLPLSGGSRGGAAAQPPAPPTHLQLVDVQTRDQLQGLIAKRFGGAPPEVFVAVYKIRGIPTTVLLRVNPAGEVIDGLKIGELAVYNRPSGAGTGHWQATSIYDVDEIEFLTDATDRPAREDMRIELWIDGLKREAGSIKVSDDELRAQATALVRHMPDPGGVTSYYWLYSHGKRLQIMEADRSHPFIGRLQVAVFSERVADKQVEEHDIALPLDQLDWFDPDPSVPFLGEPPVDWWPPGTAGYLSGLIAHAAATMGMPASRFPGMFSIAVMDKINEYSEVLGVTPGDGSQGKESPRFAQIKDFASVIGTVEKLERLYLLLIGEAAEAGLLAPPLRHNSPSWMLHFHEEYVPRRNSAVAGLFAATCQDILLDALESSHLQIQKRLDNFHAYMTVTRSLILLMLVNDAELNDLRSILQKASPAWARPSVPGGGVDKIAAWFASTGGVVSAMADARNQADRPPQRGRVRYTADGPQVQDSTGRWWSRDDLESVITAGRQEAYAVDPMLEKVADLPDVVERLRVAGADGIDDEFMALLKDLKDQNESKTDDAKGDVGIAFGLAKFQESEITSTSEIGAKLSGIHAQAATALRPLFTGDAEHAYVAGMRFLVDSELGKESLFGFLNIVGLTMLAIFCPPAAFAIGAAEAVDSLMTAYEHRGIQRALLGGDAIITKAQAEAEMWGAAIGAALVFVPEVPGIMRGLGEGAGALARSEAREAGVVAGQQIAKRAATHLAELAAKDLLTVFAEECLKAYVLNLAINAAVGRFTDAVAREVSISGHASIGDLSDLIGRAISGPPEKKAAQ
jgi:hypothetical protein